MNKLQGKTALITGGNSGIGFATAQEFIAQGAKVIITGRNAQAVAEATQKLGKNAYGIVSDAGKYGDIEALPNQIRDFASHLDILFINAGIATFAPLEFADEAHFDSIMDINFKGAFFTLQKTLPLLKSGSSVIFLSSINAHTGMANTAVYAASKAAMNSLARTSATELAPQNIRVNIVSPGPIDTPIFSKTGLSQEQLQGFAETLQQKIPLKRFGESTEVSQLVTFLASDESKFITGSEFIIDGGLSIKS
jgi:NAD(P)-dependent dehydrogenase (short-subunit alcohol dehydrogenase family)